MSALIRSRLIYLRCVRSGCEQPQQRRPLFDHLVGAGQECLWDRKAERFGRAEIDDEIGHCLAAMLDGVP
jgi:hypothetical protein